jgi:hypothetical protein
MDSLDRQNKAPTKMTITFSGEKGACPYCMHPGFIQPGPCQQCATSCGDELPQPRKRGWKSNPQEISFDPQDNLDHMEEIVQ